MAADAGGAARWTPNDALRTRLATVLERLAADRQGPLRARIDARVAALRGASGAGPDCVPETRGAGTATTPSTRPTRATPPARPGLAALKALATDCARPHAEHTTSPPSAGSTAASTGPATAAPAAFAEARPELKSLRMFRSTWTRLAAERRLAQSQAAQPDNAGPLNSHRLVHRALTLMQDTSPEYLHHFIAYVDTLMRLEPAPAAATAPAARDRPVPKGGKKPRRST